MKKMAHTLLFAAVLGLTSVPNAGEATIVYVPDSGFTMGDEPGQAISIEFGVPSAVLAFNTYLINESDTLWGWLDEARTMESVDNPGLSPARLDAGTEIGGNLSWNELGRSTSHLAYTNGEGTFYDITGFAGLRVFENEAGWRDPDALPYYGWIRIEHNASAGTLTVHDWAWNSIPGEPILAGAIPEPRVYALAFGLGVLGFVLARRWRGKFQ